MEPGATHTDFQRQTQEGLKVMASRHDAGLFAGRSKARHPRLRTRRPGPAQNPQAPRLGGKPGAAHSQSRTAPRKQRAVCEIEPTCLGIVARAHNPGSSPPSVGSVTLPCIGSPTPWSIRGRTSNSSSPGKVELPQVRGTQGEGTGERRTARASSLTRREA